MLPDSMAIKEGAFRVIKKVYKQHGAVEIDTPVFERKDLLLGKYGE
jgi:histidyl-tRNA synthetase